MTMTERYRSPEPSLKELTALILSLILLTGGAYLLSEYFGTYSSHMLRDTMTVLILYVVSLCILTLSTRRKNCSFTADDYSVTFSRRFSKDETIFYRDIDTIAVYNKYVRRGGRNGQSYYVETMVITTLDGEDHFIKAVMDIRPNSRLIAQGLMDKMLEMGKLSVLKRFIEAREVY